MLIWSRLAKFLITWVLLECEADYRGRGGNPNRKDHPSFHKDNWYRFLVQKLTIGCVESASLLENEVSFITFNYDVSLEYQLYNALVSNTIFDKSDVDKFM